MPGTAGKTLRPGLRGPAISLSAGDILNDFLKNLMIFLMKSKGHGPLGHLVTTGKMWKELG